MPWLVTVEFDDGSVAVESLTDPLNVLAYVQLSLGGHPPRRIVIVSRPVPSSRELSARYLEARTRLGGSSSAGSLASSPRR